MNGKDAKMTEKDEDGNYASFGRIGGNFIIEHVNLVAPTGVLEDAYIWVRDGVIESIGSGTAQEALGSFENPKYARHAEDLRAAVRLDGAGHWLLPGFIDLHVHGGAGHDFMDADDEGLRAITRFHARHGTTSMLATSMTASREELTRMLAGIHQFRRGSMPYAQLLGVHLEGPHISMKWRGAQNPDYIVPPQTEWLAEWTRDYPGLIQMQTLAPELPGALEYIAQLSAAGAIAACGHTDALYEQIARAADHGLRHAVHTFNAMRPYHHREPGTVGAVMTDKRIMTEIIADGHHVHPAGIRLLLAAKGVNNVILVTDAMAAAGQPDGEYVLGGLQVRMESGIARLKEGGNLAGSTLTMLDAFRFMVREVGVSVVQASQMASSNPARQLGTEAIGALKPGAYADMLLLDDELGLRQVWIGGNPALA